jgi:arylsulfatase A-like enzyme
MKDLTPLLLLAVLLPGCGPPVPTRSERPNVLWVVWDTVRADRLSLYGYELPTTPFLETWSRDARVFDDCLSTAGSTMPSHASMFTGLLPSEHGAYHTRRKLDDAQVTIAELLKDAGYRTYLFAANPHIQEAQGFHQGFDTHEHPWSDSFHDRALEIVRGKIDPQDRSSGLPARLQSSKVKEWAIKASGELAQEALLAWLERRDQAQPYFAFLNYMEAHTPYIPPRHFREKLHGPGVVERTYRIDNSYGTRWAYTFGEHDYPPGDVEAMGAVYDATLLELDTLFRELIGALEKGGYLENTVVILTADHGEHLGEHHLVDHQYSLYDPLLRVPLVVHYPERFAPGRDSSPVATFDLFPTLLELAKIEAPEGSLATSLLSPAASRNRLSEYPAAFEPGIKANLLRYPDWDPSPWQRRLRAFYGDRYKLLCSTDGRHELYDLEIDPGENDNLWTDRPDLGQGLLKSLLETSETLRVAEVGAEVTLTEEEKRRLQALGYLSGGGAEPETLGVDGDSGCGF